MPSPDLQPHLDALERAIASATPEEVPALAGELERLRISLWARVMASCDPPLSGPSSNGHERLLTAAQAAERMGISRPWLYKNADRLPFTVRLSRRVLFSARGLEEWLRKRVQLS